MAEMEERSNDDLNAFEFQSPGLDSAASSTAALSVAPFRRLSLLLDERARRVHSQFDAILLISLEI